MAFVYTAVCTLLESFFAQKFSSIFFVSSRYSGTVLRALFPAASLSTVPWQALSSIPASSTSAASSTIFPFLALMFLIPWCLLSRHRP